MRFDSVGLFWEDAARAKRGGEQQRVMAPVPETGWRPPEFMPDLTHAPCIAIDLETYDPHLTEKGPGWARNDGHVVGVAIGVPGGGRWYFPVAHEVEPEMNMDKDRVMAWCRHTLSDPRQPKLGANILYDLGWFRHEGVEVAGELIDVQFAEALLDEEAEVNLEALGAKYLHVGKTSEILYDWCAQSYGGNPNEKQRKNIYRSPPRLVGPYAEGDVDLPLRLAEVMYPLLYQAGVLDLFNLENRLIRVLHEMRWRGVRVDVAKAEQLSNSLAQRAAEAKDDLAHMVGTRLDVNSSAGLAIAFDTLGITYPRTEKGAPSFKAQFLEQLDHPIGDAIRKVRKLEKLKGTFIDSYVLGSHRDGVVYGQFHSLRGDDNGTRSGRLASSTPNLQNLPSRDEELSPEVRGVFVPDYGKRHWRKYDYSQIEYRFLLHYAVGPGAESIRAHFNANPDTDYHEFVLDMVAPLARWDISTKELRKIRRRPLKNINFGLIYGMGKAKLIRSLKLSMKEGNALFAHYHEAIPYARATMEATSLEAQASGLITTITGRRSYFNMWEPDGKQRRDDQPPLPYGLAIMKYGKIKRSMTHKALNRRLQGSAADMMKTAMVRCYEDGVFAETGFPSLTVHDELDGDDDGSERTDKAYKEMRNVMESCMKLSIPVRADGDIGPDWGHVNPIVEEAKV